MNCRELIELAPLYLSGELDAARARTFRAHLDSCGACRRHIEEEIELDGSLRNELLAAPIDSVAVEQRVRAAITATPPARRAVPWRGAAAIAATVVAAALALFALRGSFQQKPVRLCSDAARDHLREIVRQEPRRWTDDQTGVQALAARLGLSPSIPAKFAVPGYQLKHGKFCRLDGRIYLHLVYSNGLREFSLFLGKGPAGALYAADFEGEHTASVGSTTVVVSDESGEQARSLARIAASTL